MELSICCRIGMEAAVVMIIPPTFGSRWHPPACVAVAPATLSSGMRRALTCSPRDAATWSKHLSSRANRAACLQQMGTDNIDEFAAPFQTRGAQLQAVRLLLVRGVRPPFASGNDGERGGQAVNRCSFMLEPIQLGLHQSRLRCSLASSWPLHLAQVLFSTVLLR